MRIITSTILLLTVCLAFADKPQDASDLFLRAFGEFQKGEKQVAGNSVTEATQAFKKAGELLKELETRHPDWNKAIVEYRKGRVAAALEKLQAQPAAQEAPGVMAVPPTEDLICCFGFPEKLEAPSDIFLRAFTASRKGEKLATENSVAEATQAFKQAAEALKELETRHPDWNPAIVKFRKGRVAAALEKIQGRPGSPATEAPRVPPEMHRSPDINQLPPNKPSTEQWQQFQFNGQPYFFVPLMVPADKALRVE
ncbi:hypothetical protein ACXR0O_18510 [Verrucomicrobiota bacterium sgz303538]